MTGRAEVHRLKQVLDATFQRAANLSGDPELQSDFARYLCVLVSGFLEKAVIELILEHTRRHAGPSVLRFVESRGRRLANINAQRLQDVLGMFKPEWRDSIKGFLVDERKDAVNSIVALRNTIAHGQSVGVTLVRVKEYYRQVQNVVDHVADLCVPLS